MSARLRLIYRFPVGGSNDNQHFHQLAAGSRTLVRRKVAKKLAKIFPLAVRDEWTQLVLDTDADGSADTADTSSLVAFRLNDPRITQDVGIDPAQIEVIYDIHDNVHSFAVGYPVILEPIGGSLSVPVPVGDPALPGGSGTLEAFVNVELGWETGLGNVTP